MEIVLSYADAKTKFARKKRSLLLLYKSGHLESECAYHNLEMALKDKNSISAYIADVNTVLDVHPNYGVGNVPSLLFFERGKLIKYVKGCQTNRSYKTLIDKTFNMSKNSNSSKHQNVIVYSTPACGWCNSLKKWLQVNNVIYNDIDISCNEEAALSLIKRSGHKGVPQIEINNEIVVGFQLPRLKELLEIR
jgi:glutaredoxin